MRLFLILVCCLAIPFVAHGEDQNSKAKKKQPTQGKGHQQQAQHQQAQHQQAQHQQAQQIRTQGKHQSANMSAQQTHPSQVKSQRHPQALKAQANNMPAVQSHPRQNTATKHHSVNTVATHPSHLRVKTDPRAVSAQNNKVQAVPSNPTARVEARHFNLSRSPNATIQSATFNQNYRIHGSENWQGQQYAAFHNYRGEWHDQGWWHNHYNRIVLISGGWYFWNAGYWAPAWGYNSEAAYYPYNGPIYAYNNLPPDQVIANVQSTLQSQGYYRGEVDGLLGPATRSALADYQGDHGLYRTEAIDEPTLSSLGLS
jgi:hypothetical protein